MRSKILTIPSLRLPRLVVTAFICLVVGMNTHLEAANTSHVMAPSARPHAYAAMNKKDSAPENLQVLSQNDEELYRGIFAAQANGDWKKADDLIAGLKDRGLIGHVLADRYERRLPASGELREWLAAYADLPEASDFYKRLRRMPLAKGTKLDRPDFADVWSGSDNYQISYGFKLQNGPKLSEQGHRLEDKINNALRHGNPIGAEDLLFAEWKHRSIPSEELGEDQGRIAAGFYYAGVTEYSRKVAMESATALNPLGLWIAGLSAWKAGDIHAACDDFTKLAVHAGLSSSDQAAAAFWAARALKASNRSSESRVMLERAAKQTRGFYGVLANALLGREAPQSWQMPSMSEQSFGILTKTSAGWRALALLQIDQKALAEKELRHLNPQGQGDLQEAMLAVTEANQMPSLTLQLGGIANEGKRYDAALYPLPPWKPTDGFQVDRALIFALMRHESHFNPMAVSGKGACGLMQLMPTTARLISDEKVTKACSGRILDPSFNMALGQKYVRLLAGEPMIKDNLLFLLAAYNGGPGKLLHWTDEGKMKDPLLFIESMPLHETREYVQQVLMHYWNYRARLAESRTSMAQLARGEWPRFALQEEIQPAGSLKEAEAQGFEVASSQK